MTKTQYANYEVRSSWMTVAWFIIEEDVEAFSLGDLMLRELRSILFIKLKRC